MRTWASVSSTKRIVHNPLSGSDITNRRASWKTYDRKRAIGRCRAYCQSVENNTTLGAAINAAIRIH